jgi:TIGR03009 family protein
MPRSTLLGIVLALLIAPISVSAQQAQQVPQATGAPNWYPLSPQNEKWLDDVLKFWEFQATQVQRYRCQFNRWEYDPVQLPNDPEIAWTVAQGTIQYASPDKGLFRVDKLWQIAMQKQGEVTLPVIEGGKPKYVQQEQILGEHWICDGKATFQFDGLNKQLIRRELPPEMQGKQIAEGPLPFLFGAKAQTMKERYWLRIVPPPPGSDQPPIPGHFLIEAIPKRREEAAEYLAIHVVIDEKEFLPNMLTLWDRVGGKSRYEFANREKNWSMLPPALNPFHRQFYAPEAPDGWKKVNEPFRPDPPAAGVPAITRVPQAGPMRR